MELKSIRLDNFTFRYTSQRYDLIMTYYSGTWRE
jgi:hypothetical protein